MMCRQQLRRVGRRHERGATMVELAISGMVFAMAMFGLLEMGRYMTTQNTLSEAARRGARYAATVGNTTANDTAIKNMVLYRQTTAGTQPVAYGLTAASVVITRSANFGMRAGEVTVTIQNYQFNLTIPLLGTTFTQKPISASANAESAGVVPGNI
ncbi:MAG: hypothetical protein HOP19_05320 [Acidobacteria bacterium]|nr:hypothetical protein [Acidobacteriota bacterium]